MLVLSALQQPIAATFADATIATQNDPTAAMPTSFTTLDGQSSENYLYSKIV